MTANFSVENDMLRFKEIYEKELFIRKKALGDVHEQVKLNPQSTFPRVSNLFVLFIISFIKLLTFCCASSKILIKIFV